MFDQANSINTLRSLCSCNLEVYWSGFCEMLLHFIVNLSNGLYLSVNPVTRLRSVTFGVQPSRLLQSTINSHLKKKPVFWLGGYVTFRSFYWQIIVNNNSQQCDSLADWPPTLTTQTFFLACHAISQSQGIVWQDGDETLFFLFLFSFLYNYYNTVSSKPINFYGPQLCTIKDFYKASHTNRNRKYNIKNINE